MTYKEIVKKVKNNKISIENALQELSNIGHCPNLLNDDNGHWAVTFDGMQTVSAEDKPIDIVTTLYVEAENWFDSIQEALIKALSE